MKFETKYQTIIDYILTSGKRLTKKAGKIADIGITKSDLTEEDLAIERGFKNIIKSYGEGHTVYAEEENQELLDAENVWILDPISGTNTFIKGLGHYAVVAAHLYQRKVKFAAVYDPSMDELFTAQHGKGAYLNSKRIIVSQQTTNTPTIVFNRTLASHNPETASQLWNNLDKLGKVYRNTNSFAVNYCHVACGRYDGVVTMSKDTFPEFAGSLILREAGGIFTNLKKQENFKHDDRVFIGGNKENYARLFQIVKETTEN